MIAKTPVCRTIQQSNLVRGFEAPARMCGGAGAHTIAQARMTPNKNASHHGTLTMALWWDVVVVVCALVGAKLQIGRVVAAPTARNR